MPLTTVAAATGRLLVNGRFNRMRLAKEATMLRAKEPRRRWINRHPDYASSDLTAAAVDRLRAVPSVVDVLGLVTDGRR